MSDVENLFKDVVVISDFKLRRLLESAKELDVQNVSVEIVDPDMRKKIKELKKLEGFRIMSCVNMGGYTYVIFSREY
jgi:hypothetical protein